MLGLRITTSLTLLAIAATLVGPWGPCLLLHVHCMCVLWASEHVCIAALPEVRYIAMSQPRIAVTVNCDPRWSHCRCHRYFLKQRNYYKANIGEHWWTVLRVFVPKCCRTLPLQGSRVTNDTSHTTFSKLDIQVSREVPFSSNSTSQQHVWKRKNTYHVQLKRSSFGCTVDNCFPDFSAGDADSRGADEFFQVFQLLNSRICFFSNSKLLFLMFWSERCARWVQISAMSGTWRPRLTQRFRSPWNVQRYGTKIEICFIHFIHFTSEVLRWFIWRVFEVDGWQCWCELVKASKPSDFGTVWLLWCSCGSFEGCYGRRFFFQALCIPKVLPIERNLNWSPPFMIQHGLKCRFFERSH